MSDARDVAIGILNGARVTARTVGAFGGPGGDVGEALQRGTQIADYALGFVVRLLKRQTAEEALATLRQVAEEGEGPITDEELDADVQDVIDELRGD